MFKQQLCYKRVLDIILSLILLSLTLWIIIIGFILASISTKSFGIFVQKRVGQFGKPFNLLKLKTMKNIPTINTTISSLKDPRITKIGLFLRQTKIDELPQLFNILLGHMSFVGPRADVKEYIDLINVEDKKIILSFKPGLTGPATLKYINEEQILACHDNPEEYYMKYIFHDKNNINKEYILNYSFKKDIYYIILTAWYLLKKLLKGTINYL